jgi:hypothetical protein
MAYGGGAPSVASSSIRAGLSRKTWAEAASLARLQGWCIDPLLFDSGG